MIREWEDVKFAWKMSFAIYGNDRISKSKVAGFDKNEYGNECIIIRKWLDSEKTVDLWDVWEFFDVVLGLVRGILWVIEYEFLL